MDYEQIWQQVKTDLKNQMTQATYFAWIQQTQVERVDTAVEPERWIIDAGSQAGVEWLNHRLKTLVQNSLIQILGYPVEVEFTASEETPRPPLVAAPALTDRPHQLALINPDDQNLVDGIDFAKLWFEAKGSGYDRIAKYWSQFWRAYLNRQNTRAYSLWEYLQVSDKRPAGKPPHWTPVRKYQARPLSRVLGCAPASITGGFRQCSIFNRAIEMGEQLDECCGYHTPAELCDTRTTGQPQCRFWDTGAFEVLYQEGLLAIRITGASPRNTHYHLQVWRLLPLLTPSQVENLHEVERAKHDAWLEIQESKNFLDKRAWQQFQEKRMVGLMADRDRGRDIFDRYQPNPLLDSMESNNEPSQPRLDSMESNNEPDRLRLDSMESKMMT